MMDRHYPTQPLSRSAIRLQWVDGRYLKCDGVLWVIQTTLRDTQVFLDFHVFDIPEGSTPLIVVRIPIAALTNSDIYRGRLQLQLGNEQIDVNIDRTLNAKIEAKPEIDPLQEVMSLSLEEMGQTSLEEEALSDFSTVEEPLEFEELGESLRPEAPKIELKQLPPGLKYAFLNGKEDTPVIINDKLIESERQRLILVLEKYRTVLGYSLQDLK
ncbi:hypothetical protein BS78_K270100 [Paspalum vaginatum]|uniref:Uncharacterized protein n=1 Tax=Paspalum vaginatum TaxID=158149 RepID=A0A9W7XAC9_9POAL|nr:hypothetical protein BS78_K270100 [Paspalum vaginatum]